MDNYQKYLKYKLKYIELKEKLKNENYSEKYLSSIDGGSLNL